MMLKIKKSMFSLKQLYKQKSIHPTSEGYELFNFVKIAVEYIDLGRQPI